MNVIGLGLSIIFGGIMVFIVGCIMHIFWYLFMTGWNLGW